MPTLEEIDKALASRSKDNTLEDVDRAFQTRRAPKRKAPTRTVSDYARDVGVTAAKGIVGLGHNAIGLMDIPMQGHFGKSLEKVGYDYEGTQKILSEGYSDAQKLANRKVADEKGFMNTLDAMVENPSTILTSIGESVPSMLAGGAVAKGLTGLTSLGRLTAAAIGEGSMAAGSTQATLRDESDDGLNTAKDTAISIATGIGTGVFNLIGGRIAKKAKITDVDSYIAGLKNKGVEMTPTKWATGIAKGGIQEGVIEELPQSIQEQMWMNVAQDRPIMEGVPETAAGAILSGGVMGAGVNTASPILNRQSPEEKAETAQALVKAEEYKKNKAAIEKAGKENIKRLKDQNLTGEELVALRENTSLNEFGVSPADIDGIIANSKIAGVEAANLEAMLSSAPTDAIKNGILSTARGKAMAKAVPFLERAEVPQPTSVLDPGYDANATKVEEATTETEAEIPGPTPSDATRAAVEGEGIEETVKAPEASVAENESEVINEEEEAEEVLSPNIQDNSVQPKESTVPTNSQERDKPNETVAEPEQSEREILEDRSRVLGQQAYNLEKQGKTEEANALYAEQEAIDGRLETDERIAPTVEESTKTIDQQYMDLDELQGQHEEAVAAGQTENAAMLEEQVYEAETQIEIAETREAFTEAGAAQENVDQLAKKEIEINERTAEFVARTAAGQTNSAGALEKYINQQLPYMLDRANRVPLENRTEESIENERKVIMQVAMQVFEKEQAAMDEAMNESFANFSKATVAQKKAAEKELGISTEQLTERLVELSEFLDGNNTNAQYASKPKSATGTPKTTAEVTKAVEKELGKVPKFVVIVPTVKDLPFGVDRDTPPDVAGMAFDGKFYLVAENVDETIDLKGLIVHEGGHWLRRNDKVYQKRYQDLLSSMLTLSKDKGKGKDAIALQKAKVRALENNKDLDPENDADLDLLIEEAVMYYLYDKANVDLPMYKKFISFIKQFVYKHFGVAPAKLGLTGHDWAQIIVSDLKRNANNKVEVISLVDQIEAQSLKMAKENKNSEIAPSDEMLKWQKKADRVILQDTFGLKRPQSQKSYDEKIVTENKKSRETGKKSTNPVVKKVSSLVDKIDPKGVGFVRGEKSQTTNWFTKLFGSPEYFSTKDSQADKIVKAAENADQKRYIVQTAIEGSFPEVSAAFKKYSPKEYDKAGRYLVNTDKQGDGFSLKEVDGKWHGFDRKGKRIFTYEDREAASEALIEAEFNNIEPRLGKDAAEFVKLFRLLMDRSLYMQLEQQQRQVDNAEHYDLGEPTIAGPDSPTISEAMVQTGDLQGNYFPRIRQNKGSFIRMESTSDPTAPPVLLTADIMFKNTKRSNMNNNLKEIINRVGPAGSQIKEWRAKGYEVTEISPGNAPADSIFDVQGVVTAMDALLGLAEDSTEDADRKAVENLNNLITYKIADIYNAKGNMSSRVKRTKNNTQGYETDPIKAAISHVQRVSAGIAKQQTAREMTLAFTGRDVSFKDYKKANPNASFKDYKKMVQENKIDPIKQRELYNDMRTYMSHVLKPASTPMRAIGYLKALTVVKYLGYRISSPAINMTNMAAAVPATMSAHTGIGLAESFKLISSAAGKYASYRGEQGTFKGPKQDWKDRSIYNVQRGTKGFAKGVTKSLGVKLTDEEYDIFEQIKNRGWDEANFNMESTQAVQTYAGVWFQNFVSYGMYMFGATEKANRAMTIFAAYQAHKQAHPEMNKEDLLTMAQHTSNRAHGSYGKATKPWLVQKYPVLDLPYMFQKFQHNYILNMYEMGVKHKDYAAVLHMILAPGVMAGIGAPIFATPIFAALAALGIGGDDPEEEFYSYLEKNLPTVANRLARHGVAGAMGINIKGSLNSPLNEIAKLKDATLLDMGGAPMNAIIDEVEAGKLALKGEYSKALEKALPTGWAGPFKAGRLSTEGVTTQAYAPAFFGKEQLKATPMETALLTFGLNPSRISGLREKQWHEKTLKKSYKKDRDAINRLLRRYYIQAQSDGGSLTPKQLMEIETMVNEYNERVQGSNRNVREKPLSWKKLHTNLKNSMTPSVIERER